MLISSVSILLLVCCLHLYMHKYTTAISLLVDTYTHRKKNCFFFYNLVVKVMIIIHKIIISINQHYILACEFYLQTLIFHVSPKLQYGDLFIYLFIYSM